MRTILISLALLTMISSYAYGHKIYIAECDDSEETTDKYQDIDSDDIKITLEWMTGEPAGILGRSAIRASAEVEKCYSNSPEAKSLRASNPDAPESDRVAAMTFCKISGYEHPADCASDILHKGLVDESKACVDKLWNEINNPTINPVAHKLGGATTATEGVWHFDYRTSKEDGSHRHAYTDTMRDTAARTYASAQIEMEKKRREVNSRSHSNTTMTETTVGVNASVNVGVPVSGPSVTIGGGAGGSGGSEKGISIEKGPMTQTELDELWKKYYDRAYADPQIAGYGPNVLCMRNEKECLSSSGQTIKNTSFQPDASAKKEEVRSNKNNSESKQPNNSTENDKTPSQSSPSSHDEERGGITVKNGGSWAGEPSKPSDGSVWTDFGQEEPGNDPMAQCIFDAHKEKLEASSNTSYDTDGAADTRSDAQKKRDAETLLRQGICDGKYFGRDYCASWKKKRELIESAPDAFDEKKPIVQPGMQQKRPGYLHFDPDREPIPIPTGFTPGFIPGARGDPIKLPK